MKPATVAAASTSTSSARPLIRPKSAGVGVRPPLLIRGDDEVTIANGNVATHRIYTKPRPPSASSALSTTRRPRPQPLSQWTSPRGDSSSIAPQILREEIETQCRVTRRAQREYNALRVQHAAKIQEIALLQRHLQAYDVDALTSPRRAATQSASTVVGGPRGRPLTILEQLKDETRRLDAYKKTLRTMLDRLARHMQYLRANAELLESQRVSAAREATLCQDKVAQDKSLCAELETKRQHLTSERVAHALHAQQLLASLRTEIESRTRVSEQRQDADRRREEMLRLVKSRPPEPTVHNVSNDQPPLEKRHSYGRRDSFRMLMDESLRFFGSPVPGSRSGSVDGSPDHVVSASTAAMGVTLSSRRLQSLRLHSSTAAAESLAAAMRRETFFQVYETQYERILEQTGESDLAIVLERFRNFKETRARLEQIEKDLASEDTALDAVRLARTEQLQQLRLSGIAEVERRKKIRDFLEHQYVIKSTARAHAKDVFVEQLKTFSYVQQGILNITELLKCLDVNFSPPALPAASSPTNSASPIVHHSVRTTAATVEIDWLQSLLFSCRSIVRATSSMNSLGDFTPEQIARLGEIDRTVGLAAGAWVVERLKHSIPGGNLVWTSGPGGQYIEDAEDDGTEAEGDEEDGFDDSDSDIDDRIGIKEKEAERVAQAELLIRTLDSRQQFARQEQTMQRMRRAFGLGKGSEDNVEENSGPTVPALDAAAKLAAVHAFFREKRLHEKHEQQDRREVIAALGGFTQISNTARKRGSFATLTGGTMNTTAAIAMASIVAEMRAGAAARRPSVSVKPPTPGSLTVFTTAAKPPQPRKRSNAVSLSVPPSAQGDNVLQTVKPLSSSPAEGASKRQVRMPMRPTSGSLQRRGSNGQSSGTLVVANSGQERFGRVQPNTQC